MIRTIGVLSISLFFQTLNGENLVEVYGNSSEKCVVDAKFVRIDGDEIDVIVDCSKVISQSTEIHFYDRFSDVSEIYWNGEQSGSDLKCFGLYHIISKNQVRFLQIEGFSLLKILRNCFYEFQNLKTLVIQKNLIESIDEGTFNNLINLEELKISQNNLKVFGDVDFSRFDNIKVFEISEQNLNSWNDLKFAENQTLEIARIRYCLQKTSSIHSLISHSKNIEICVDIDNLNLDLADSLSIENATIWINSIGTRIFIDSVEPLVELKINSKFPCHLHMKNLVNLQILKYNNVVITNDTLEDIGKLNNLQILELRNCNITEIPKNAFENLKSLKELNLQNNQLEFIQLTTSESLKIFIDQNPLDCTWLTRNPLDSRFVFAANHSNINVNGLPCSFTDSKIKTSKTETSCQCIVLFYFLFVCSAVISIIFLAKFYNLKKSLYKNRKEKRDNFAIINYSEAKADNIQLRKLPPTAYEQPISVRISPTDIKFIFSKNHTYEEIPSKLFY